MYADLTVAELLPKFCLFVWMETFFPWFCRPEHCFDKIKHGISALHKVQTFSQKSLSKILFIYKVKQEWFPQSSCHISLIYKENMFAYIKITV